MSIITNAILPKKNEKDSKVMKIRKTYGTKNCVGKNIETMRKAKGLSQSDFIAKLQVAGLDIDKSSFSKLEGQVRSAYDIEIYIIAKILGVPMEKLFE